VVTALLILSGVSDAFTTAQSPICSTRHQITSTWMSTPSDSDVPANLVSQQAFITAIDVLKKDMGMEIIPDDQRPMYAIGKLECTLPLESVSGIRFADCETLTLISQIKQSVVDETGMQSLDTIVAIRAGGEGGYEGDVNGKPIAETAQCYTDAINHAVQNGLKGIELELNRLVPLMPSTDDAE